MFPAHPQPAGLPSGTIGGRKSRRASAGWQWRHLLAAPHRLAFTAGALMMSLALLWWGAALLAKAVGVALPWALPSATAHALLLAFGVMPCFLTGLTFTAGPRWLNVPAVSARALSLPLAGMLGGWALALVGFHVSAALAAAGLAMAAGGLALIAGRFAVMLLGSRVGDRDHARGILLGLAVAALAQWGAAVAVALGADLLARAAVQAALWGGFGMVFVVAAHRMLPVFAAAVLPAQAAWRPRVLLAVLMWLMGLQAVFAVAGVVRGGVAGAPAAIAAALDLSGGLVLFWLALRWGLRQSLGGRSAQRGALRLLAMLHLGFAWLAVSFTLNGVSQVLMFATEGQLSLGLAPLHAFTMGFMGSTLLALATRVALDHAGRPLVADHWTWVLAWVVQAGVLMSVLAALFPVAATPLTLLAAQFWTVAGLTWAARHLRWFGRQPT